MRRNPPNRHVYGRHPLGHFGSPLAVLWGEAATDSEASEFLRTRFSDGLVHVPLFDRDFSDEDFSSGSV